MGRRSHWINAGLTFIVTVIAAGVLLPLVREYPNSVHSHLNGLNCGIRILFTFSLCVVFTGVMFKLLSPRLGHLAHWKTHPPAWLAALAAWILVAIFDLFVGFDADGHRRPHVWEWMVYGGGALAVVCGYSWLVSWSDEKAGKKTEEQAEISDSITQQDLQKAQWEEIEDWLKSDVVAKYDFLGNQSIAHRVSDVIAEGTRSIGIVGPYGAGKSSIVKWVTERLKRYDVKNRRFFVCHHSCWGFETSASAISEMLRSAVSKLGDQIDTFQIDSLPESYRKTFSAGGDWIETISNLVLRTPDLMTQFDQLSQLLNELDWRLVFVVEDLDRHETRNFEIQEVLGFLERLKTHKGFSFILTGGRYSSQKIDYAKLCDHIENLRTLQPQHALHLICRVRDRCLDQSAFTYILMESESENSQWDYRSHSIMRDYQEFSFAEACAVLLDTPRSLRHALGRTLSAWKTLHGEINFDDLLTVNILRFGAPECFDFLMRRWDQLHYSSRAEDRKLLPDGGQSSRQAVCNDWNHMIQNVEWSPSAALKLMMFILPATEYWLVDQFKDGGALIGFQRVFEKRYWDRAISELIEENNDVRDQEVIRDIRAWMDAPDMSTELVFKLTTSSQYADIWGELAERFFSDRQQDILKLCGQVIQRILDKEGGAASHDSQGFFHTWGFAQRYVKRGEGNSVWLQEQISAAARVSIDMVNSLWHFYGNPGKNSILMFDDGEPVRRHVLNTMRLNVTNGDELSARLSPTESATLYQLVFDPGNESKKFLTDVQDWTWLGNIILEALRSRSVTVAANCGVLLSQSLRKGEFLHVNTDILDPFFGKDASEVIDHLESMIDEIPQADRPLVRNVITAARQLFSTRGGTQNEVG